MKKILFNPFEKYSETQLFIFGIATAVLSTYLSYVFNARFDGAIDMHLVKNITLKQAITDNIINIASLFATLYAIGFFINKKVRPIDILNTVLVARSIYCIMPFTHFAADTLEEFAVKTAKINPLDPAPISFTATEIITISIVALLGIITLIWTIALLYNGFKTATNLKTITHKVLFAIAIILAEVLSILFITALN